MQTSKNIDKIRILSENVQQRLIDISTEEVSLAIRWLDDKLRNQQQIEESDVAELCISLTRLQANVHVLKEAFKDLLVSVDSTTFQS